MNARQKAKRLKKELDFIKNMPLKTVEIIQPTKTYRVKQTVSTDDLYMMTGDAEDVHAYIYKSLKNELAEKIASDIYFKIEPSFIPYHTDITGEITIVERKR